MFFNGQYISNCSTDPIKTKSIRKIEFQLYIHILKFITICEQKQLQKRTVDKGIWNKVDANWRTVYNVLIPMNVEGLIFQ